MKLNVEVWDVEIHTGTLVHYSCSVFVKFRRQPDSDVLKDLQSLRSEYGWEVQDLRELKAYAQINRADFEIKCVGADSYEVGNALVDQLEGSHGLRCRRLQVIGKFGKDGKFYFVEKLRKVDAPTSSDVLVY